MSHSKSVDGLSFHHNKSGASNSIKFKYDDTQADTTGECAQEKNCYANPLKPHVCFFLTLGSWLSLNAEGLERMEQLILNKGAKFGTTA